MIMIFQMVIKISIQMQAFSEPDCLSIFIECLHLHWNLNNHLNDHDQNLKMDRINTLTLYQTMKF